MLVKESKLYKYQHTLKGINMSLITQAQKVLLEDRMLIENINLFAKSIDCSIDTVFESVTHVLAGLSQNSNAMNPKTTASFLAGIEKLSNILPSANIDANRKQNTIRLLIAAAMQFNDLTKQSLPNSAAVKIAQYGAGDSELIKKYLNIVQQGPESITKYANQLKSVIDRVITTNQGQQKSIPPQQSGQQSKQGPQSVLKLQPQSNQSNTSNLRPTL
jgi:hypothetical protein